MTEAKSILAARSDSPGFLNRGLELRLVTHRAKSTERATDKPASGSTHAHPRSQIPIGYPPALASGTAIDRNAALTASALGKRTATSGSSRTRRTLSVARLAYFPIAGFARSVKSQFVGISSKSGSLSVIWVTVCFVPFRFSGTHNPNRVVAISMPDNKQSTMIGETKCKKAILVITVFRMTIEVIGGTDDGLVFSFCLTHGTAASE